MTGSITGTDALLTTSFRGGSNGEEVKNKTSPNKTGPFSNDEIGLEMLEIGLKMSGAGSEGSYRDGSRGVN